MRVLIVDDHDVVRLGLRALLSAEPDVDVVGEAGTAADAVRLVAATEPDVVLMDVRLPDESGIAACRQIRSHWPRVQVLVLTSYADEALVLEAIEAGAAGYVLKQVDTTDLVRAVHAVAAGDAVLDPATTARVLAVVRRTQHESRASAFHDFTDRELEILALVAKGKTNAEIAEQLILSEKTVRNHVSVILAKLGVTNRIEAATYAVRHQIEQHTDRS